MSDVLDLIIPLPGDRFHVRCTAHGGKAQGDLDRIVDSQEHAVNLERKHVREYHPGAQAAWQPLDSAPPPTPTTTSPRTVPAVDGLEVNLSAVAPLALMAYSLPGSVDVAAGFIAMWEALTGTSGEAAIDLAQQIQSSERTVRAAVIPF